MEGNKEMIKRFTLQIFAEDGNGNNGGANDGGNTGNNTGAAGGAGNGGANIDYDRLAQIIAGKQTATEDSVIRGYLKQQGLSKTGRKTILKGYMLIVP